MQCMEPCMRKPRQLVLRVSCNMIGGKENIPVFGSEINKLCEKRKHIEIDGSSFVVESANYIIKEMLFVIILKEVFAVIACHNERR